MKTLRIEGKKQNPNQRCIFKYEGCKICLESAEEIKLELTPEQKQKSAEMRKYLWELKQKI